MVFTVKRLLDWLQARYGGDHAPVVAGSLLVLTLSTWMFWFQPQQLQPVPQRDVLRQALATVPPGKSVLAPYRLQGYLSDREHFDRIGRFAKHPEYNAQYEYVILDANERQFPPAITREFFDSFYKNSSYRLLFGESNVFVFQRLGGESDWKIPAPEFHSAEE